MGTITARKRQDGSLAYIAQILRKKGGKIIWREAKTFDREREAKAWIRDREAELDRPGAIEQLSKTDASRRHGAVHCSAHGVSENQVRLEDQNLSPQLLPSGPFENGEFLLNNYEPGVNVLVPTKDKFPTPLTWLLAGNRYAAWAQHGARGLQYDDGIFTAPEPGTYLFDFMVAYAAGHRWRTILPAGQHERCERCWWDSARDGGGSRGQRRNLWHVVCAV